MSQKTLQTQIHALPADPRWKDLFRLGGLSAAASVAAIAVAVAAFAIWSYSPDSLSTAEVYAQMSTDRVGALMALDLIYYFSNLLAIPLCLALYAALRKVNESYALIALVLGIMSLVLLFTARPIVEVMTLADRYSAAVTEAERGRLLAAGESLLALFTGTSFYLSYFLGTLSLLIYALLMLGGNVFSRSAAWVGIATNIVALGMYLPVVGIPLAFLSLVGLVTWNIQIARTLFRLASSASAAA